MGFGIEARYWLVVKNEKRELLFKVRDDGSVEYGPNYISEKAEAAWEAAYGLTPSDDPS